MGLNPQAKRLWLDIRNPNCEECPLHEEAQTVCLIGDGPVPADYMIVGEAPGYREDEISKPFAGKSGRFLDEALGEAGLERKDFFITNVAKCRPPENRAPTKPEMKACRHYLEDELEAVKPKFILTLGNSALSLIKKSGIMKHRGEPYEYGDAVVLPTIHPAAVLRNPHYDQLFRADIHAFARLVRGEDSNPANRVFVVKNKAALEAMLKAILKAEAVAYDIETNMFEEWNPDARIATIAVSVKPGITFVAPIHHPEATWKHPERVLGMIAHALTYTNARRIAHNAKFDDRWLNKFTGCPLHADFDTIIAAHVLEENRLKGLKPLAQILLGVDSWDLDMSGGKAMLYPLSTLARYNAKDTDYTLRLYYGFKKELQDPANARITRIFKQLMMPASRVLTDVELTGMWVDQDRLAKRSIQVRSKIEATMKKLTKEIGHPVNPNSPPQLAEALFEEIGLPIIETTKGKKPSTKESVLLRLRHEHPVPNLILEYRKWAKYESTYLGPWARSLDDTGRIHPNYKLTGTVTGRLASGKEAKDDKRVGFQQVPRETLIRSVIGAPEGWTFVEADFSQVELRIAAHLAQEPTMMSAYQRGEDIHLKTAVLVTGKPPEAIEKEERKKAKAVNFGFLYGMGWRKFIDYARDNYDVKVSPEEAQAFREAFFAEYSGLPRWHERQRRLVNQYHRVQSPIGRIRHLPDIESHDKDVRMEAERQAINSPVQSMASDMMLLSMILLHDQMPMDEAKIVGTVHDSILFEVRDDRVKKWAPHIKRTMENLPLKRKFGVDLTVPIVADVTVGTHWGEGKAA